jgi:hypothetical protein
MSDCYGTIAEFDLYYLEDSFVRGFRFRDRTFQIFVAIVLERDHPEWVSPPPTHHHCWREAVITFTNVSRFEWDDINVMVEDDPDGALIGEMHSVTVQDDHLWVAADFGQVRVWSDRPTVVLLPIVADEDD